jgi:hypothetical protein
LYEKLIKSKNNDFDFTIPFSETGIYQVLIFVATDPQNKNFHVVNKFGLKVRKGFFF